MLCWVGSLRPIVQQQFHVVEIEPFAAVRLQRSGRVAQRGRARVAIGRCLPFLAIIDRRAHHLVVVAQVRIELVANLFFVVV